MEAVCIARDGDARGHRRRDARRPRALARAGLPGAGLSLRHAAARAAVGRGARKMRKLVVLAACGSSTTPAAPKEMHCEQVPFAASTPVPEASGAAWLVVDGKRVLVTMGDSGQHGAYGLIDPDDGSTLEQGKL